MTSASGTLRGLDLSKEPAWTSTHCRIFERQNVSVVDEHGERSFEGVRVFVARLDEDGQSEPTFGVRIYAKNEGGRGYHGVRVVHPCTLV